MFNYQTLGDNMSALRANQKTQVLILHGVYQLNSGSPFLRGLGGSGLA
jgi:hypothetical protein